MDRHDAHAPIVHAPVARIVIHKEARLLEAHAVDGDLCRYPVALGRNAAADKAVEGDEATPLGDFYVCAKNPMSRFLLSMCISYPNAEDAERGLAARLITRAERDAIVAAIERRALPPQHTRLGGEIYIHGEPAGAPGRGAPPDTRGCIALRNEDMRDLYARTALGTPVLIAP